MNTLGMVLSSGTAANTGSGSTMFIVVYILIFVAIIYFMMIRPQKKQKAKTEEMHNLCCNADMPDIRSLLRLVCHLSHIWHSSDSVFHALCIHVHVVRFWMDIHSQRNPHHGQLLQVY